MLSGSGDPLTPNAGGTPPANPTRRGVRLLAIAVGALGVAGAVFMLLKPRAPRPWTETRYDRRRTRELERPGETMEEVVWERRR